MRCILNNADIDGNPDLRVPLSAAKGSVDIDMDYRKRGLIYLSVSAKK